MAQPIKIEKAESTTITTLVLLKDVSNKNPLATSSKQSYKCKRSRSI